jgi:SAM-dependent methyltransferase
MNEEEIRPQKLFDKLLQLNREDIQYYFQNSDYRKIACPACNRQGSFSFNKDGFSFEECKYCKTLYVSPRPDKQSFDNYYTDSKSTQFWATEFYRATEENRREKIWIPKSRLVNEKINEYAADTQCIIDIGGGYGVFIEEFLKIREIDHLIIEPSKYLSQICRRKGLNVLEKFLEDIQSSDLAKLKNTFVSFELFEHLHDPQVFLRTLYKLMKSGDSFIFTTLSGMGVDIQALWENSKSISPPMHLNFFNPKSIEILLSSIGFEVIEISTPGKLDIDIMKNNRRQLKDRFWQNFIDYASDEEKNVMQSFISKNNLSSHMMIFCKKL